MKKILIGGMILSSLLLATTNAELHEVFKSTKTKADYEKNVEKFKKFNKRGTYKVDEKIINNFKKFQKEDNENYEKKLKDAVKKYPENQKIPMTKKQFSILSNRVIKERKNIEQNMVGDYILYLTSESVPNKSYQNLLLSVGILQENGVNIRTKQYLRGVPKNVKTYLITKMNEIKELPMKELMYIKPNIGLKFDPRLFDYFKLEKVPVIIYATCNGIPSPERCKFKYMSKGDIPLSEFFEKIADKTNDKKFKKYHQYLIGNKIVSREDNL